MPYITFDEYLIHEGTPHEGSIPHSGRYAWGSGDVPFQHRPFLNLAQQIRVQKAAGLTDAEIAEKLGILGKRGEPSSKRVREIISIDREQAYYENCAIARRLYNEMMDKKGKANVSEIARMMDCNESNVRNYLKETPDDRQKTITETADFLKGKLEKERFLDVGAGVEKSLGVTDTRLDTAITLLEEEGYHKYYIKVNQLGTGHQTTVEVLARPEDTISDLYANRDQIGTIVEYKSDTGKIWVPEYPEALDSSRVAIRYAEDGGTEKDGVIEIRQGVDDLSLGKSHYAQCRINVDDKLYLKGMAMYSDTVPEGYDVIFNTNKSKDTPFEKVLKPLKDDKDNPFGATIKAEGQLHYTDKDGNEKLGLINKVNEEGDWSTWSKTLSSQFLSKQPKELIKKQIDLTIADKKEELDEIKSISNPVIRSKFLIDFGDECDKAAADLKVKGFEGQSSHVILPITSLKEDQVYAPNYQNGQKVVLIRYPHGGQFEIPELTVNNRHTESKKLLGNATDAIGINSAVAEKLSGADFDGDTVIVIPVAGGTGNSKVTVQTKESLAGLKNFNAKESYKLPDSAPQMSEKTKQKEMGIITNLITDMSFQNPTDDEITRAVKHSMVVIDAAKHHLDYKQSYKDNRIEELKKKYQPKDNGRYGGASSLLSRAGASQYVNEREDFSVIDKETGKRVYKETGGTYTTKSGKVEKKKDTVETMYLVDDANELVSPNKHPTELLYANFANEMKAMANSSRKEAVNLKKGQGNREAKKLYADEVTSINDKVDKVLMNAPKERMAQIYGNEVLKAKVDKNPSLKEDKDHYKRLKNQILTASRAKYGANKKGVQITLTDNEWEAVNAGALSDNLLKTVIDNMDKDVLREKVIQKNVKIISDAKIAKMKAMKASGFYTTAEIAQACGVSTSTVTNYTSK